MNQFIKEELEKCIVAKPEKITDTSYSINLNTNKLPTDLEPHHFYMIEVADYILHPYEGFTLHENWNSGIKPTSKKMQVEVDQTIGNMIHVNALGDDGLIWCGWLPRKSITIKKVVA